MQCFSPKILSFHKGRPSLSTALNHLISLPRKSCYNSSLNSSTPTVHHYNSSGYSSDTNSHPSANDGLLYSFPIRSHASFFSSGLWRRAKMLGIHEKYGRQSCANFSLVSYSDAEDEAVQEKQEEDDDEDDNGAIHSDSSQDNDETMEKNIYQRLATLTDAREQVPGFNQAEKEGIFRFSSDESLTDVEKVYKIIMKFHSRIDKLEMALERCGVNITPVLVEQVLNMCGDAGKPAFRFFVWAGKKPEYRHSPEAYNAMINIMGRMTQFGTVWALLEEMRKRDPSLITAETFIIMMRRFAAARMVQKAVDVLDEMPKFGCEPDVHTFGCLLDALCKHNRVKEAVALFADMKIRFPPNLKNYTVLLNGWCKVGKLEEARVVLDEMMELGFEPDIVAHNTLLNGYAKAGKIQEAFDFLNEMKSKGCPPNTTSYTNLLQALCSAERIAEALRLFTDMKKDECFPDVVTYTALMNGLCRCEKLDQAYQLLDDMIQQGCTPNQMTYFCLLRAHERREQLKEALELVQEMSENGCDPDLHIYSTLIRLSCRLGQSNEALTIWNDMESKGVSADLDTYNILINGLLDHNKFTEACIHFKEMVRKGLMPTPQYGTLKVTLNTLLRAEKLQMAIDIWDTMKNSGSHINIYAYTIWIQALCAKGEVKEACRYCIEMMEDGLLPQPSTYDKLMKGLRKVYNRRIAEELTGRLRKMMSERSLNFKSYVNEGPRKEIEKRRSKKGGGKGSFMNDGVKALLKSLSSSTSMVDGNPMEFFLVPFFVMLLILKYFTIILFAIFWPANDTYLQLTAFTLGLIVYTLQLIGY
eukprot:Gb_19758 [translate_table: standard]